MIVIGPGVAPTVDHALNLHVVDAGRVVELIELLRAFVRNGAILPLPEEPAGHRVVLPDDVPRADHHVRPLVERAVVGGEARVPYVGVLGVDHRPLRATLLVVDLRGHLLQSRIVVVVELGTMDVREYARNQTRAGRVCLPGQVDHDLVIDSGPVVLVADRPDDDAGVVLVARNGLAGAQLEGGSQLGRVNGAPAVRKLVDDVEAHLVAEIVEAGAVGIMRRADRVDVGVFHQLEVLEPELLADGRPLGRVDVVPADAGHLNARAVHEKHAIPDRDLANSDPTRYAFGHRASRSLSSTSSEYRFGNSADQSFGFDTI